MNFKKIIQYVAPFTIIIIIALFVYDIYEHGRIVDPGQAEYKAQCAQCHGDNGEGIKSLIPPLAKSDFAANNIDSIPCWLKYGISRSIVVRDTAYEQPMYPNNNLDDIRTANLINFMCKEFWGVDKQVSSGWVHEKLKQCK